MGDPAGIGPEITLKAIDMLAEPIESDGMQLLVIGCEQTFRERAETLGLESDHIATVFKEKPQFWPAIALLDVGSAGAIAPGQVSVESGQVAYDAIRIAVEVTTAGHANAICTGPINKEALNLAGHAFGGHTELLAHLTGARESVMMLVHGNMRVSHVSTHTALANVPAELTTERLNRVFELTEEALQKMGIAKPCIAFAALNPHAGEGGLFGREDIDVTTPVIRSLREAGFDARGPVPGDTVFVKLRSGQYDAVIAMYHDQGHIPVKLLGFQVDAKTGAWSALDGVNVTLGLPIIRSSVDHGTAFDIAGKGIANPSSMVEAIRVAASLSAGSGTVD